MKTKLFFPVLLILFISCSEFDEQCVCSLEYRYYRVTVIDSLGLPVDSLSITIKDWNHTLLNVEQENFPYQTGKYVVLNDSFTQLFCSCGTPQKIYFSATDGSRNASGEFLFNTDKCKCHINKVSGPDTLILK